MTKNEFIKQLRTELTGLSENEITEILRDQEEYINDAVRAGRSENEVISSLGDPAQISREIKANYKINQANDETKLSSKTNKVFKAMAAVCVLTPFNLVFVLGPFLALCAILIAMWTVSATILVLGLGGLPFSFLGLMGGPALLLTFLFGAMFLIGLGVVSLFISYYINLFFLKMCISYLKWNFAIVAGER